MSSGKKSASAVGMLLNAILSIEATALHTSSPDNPDVHWYTESAREQFKLCFSNSLFSAIIFSDRCQPQSSKRAPDYYKDI